MFIARRVLLCFMILTVCGCGDRSAPAALFIGHVAGSGPERESVERGIRLALEDANKGTTGKPIKVLHTDTLGKLEAFETQAVRLVTVNRVAALLGGTTGEEAERLDRARVPVVTFAGSRTPATSDAVFFSGLSAASMGKALARFAVQDRKAARVLVLADERQADLLAVAEAFERGYVAGAEAKDATIKAQPPIVLRYGKDAKLQDVAWKIRALDKVDALLFAGPVRDLRELRTELGEPPPILYAGDAFHLRELQTPGGGNPADYWASPFVTDADTDRAKEFVKRYKEAFSDDPTVAAALAYDAIRLLAEALHRSQDAPTGNRLRDELSGLKDFPGLTGPLGFGEDRQARRAAFIVHAGGGKTKTVKRYGPDEI